MITKSISQYLTEEDSGYAKLTKGRFKRMRLSDTEDALISGEEGSPFGTTNIYTPDDDGHKSSAIPLAIYNQNVGTDFEVFYSFSSRPRGSLGTRYGHPGWTARFLYDFLCRTYNHGVRFIDTYIQDVFPLRPVYSRMLAMIRDMDNDIQTRWNDGQLKGGQWASFYDYQHQSVKKMQGQFKEFGKELRSDIRNCLASGMIPIYFALKPSTIRTRKNAGILSRAEFYATGWLISQIDVHVILSRGNGMSLYYSDNYMGAKNG